MQEMPKYVKICRIKFNCSNANKMGLRVIGWDGGDWIDLAQDRDQWRALVNAVMNLRDSIKRWEVLEWLHNWQLLKKGPAPRVNEQC
jgi:hypothetical protein